VTVERRHHLCDPVVRRLGVVVQQDGDLPARRAQPGVARPGEPAIRLQPDQPDFGITLAQQRLRPIGRGVVGYDHLDAWVGLPSQRVETRRQILRAIPVGDDD
jgi:hypothetical protein